MRVTNLFDYNTKYVSGRAKEVFPAPIPKHLEKKIKMLAEKSNIGLNTIQNIKRGASPGNAKVGRCAQSKLQGIENDA